MKRLVSLAALTTAAALAMATMGMMKTFETTYNIKSTSDLGKAKCQSCHTGKMGGKLTKYGADLAKAAGGAKKLTADIFKKIEGLDSDGDGVKNGDELKAGKLP